ncbi:MAG: 30S ribosome-binding factor RbfA [Acidimicrobiia bacterium]|nr:30S ribosome-binding factor RbfA [Acidimicrobiia bacterium]
MARRRSSGGRREYPRTARVNELVREIVAEELERIDDTRLEMVSVTAVEVEQELTQGVVYFSSLAGEEADAEVLGALHQHRARLQSAIGRQSRMRRTPALRFAPDGGVRGGKRIEELLAELQPTLTSSGEQDATPTGAAAPGAADHEGGGPAEASSSGGGGGEDRHVEGDGPRPQ